ncbi:methyltransferase [Streptomyces sp. SBST2-5]|uniref:Methyltransferase n=1 Tax=Streptomyces composti TaxID=2720025 RepID=A0ABX1A391_9ACTN|nr:SCO2525 family SAM-dependent methyltransferase [Streptomyces composti]NJP49181.1 methyltransferase [Streptomyces composti]
MDERRTHDAAKARPARLVEAPAWEAFDPDVYVSLNYKVLHADDASILRAGSAHFRRCLQRRDAPPPAPLSGIDVGSGANLYPALMLLPWCDEITLIDRARANVEWLRSHIRDYDQNWDAFWDVLCEAGPYTEIPCPRRRMRATTRVEQGDVFLLPGQHWGIGTMFFTAESITASLDLFREAVRCFMHSLIPGAPFAAAFMAEQRGYYVGSHSYPQCHVDEDTVREGFAAYAEEDLHVRRFRDGHALRDGYAGMILACGRRRAGR